MIEIRFFADEQVLAKDLTFAPRDADPAALEETYFVMPVRMRVEDVDLLGRDKVGDPISNLPILGFATHLFGATKRCLADGRGTVLLAGGGHLSLTLEGSDLRVESSLRKQNACCQASEFVDAANDFRESVRQFLIERVPGIETHAYWKNWFFN